MITEKRFDKPLVVGQTYLTTWGRVEVIEGFTKIGWDDSRSTDIVWGRTGYHYNIKTGECVRDGHHLVSLRRKKDEVLYWLATLKQIRSVNHVDNLRLVKEELDNMRKRVNELMGRPVLSVEQDLTEPLPPTKKSLTWWERHFGRTKQPDTANAIPQKTT